MKPRPHPQPDQDPCLEIQLDLSCLIDGELEESAVRRVLVHAEICRSCGPFLQAIRLHAKAHQFLSKQALSEQAFFHVEHGVQVEHGAAARRPGRLERMAERMVRGQLAELAEVFYQLGRAYVLLVSSPSYRRIIEKEPVSIPEYRLRGRALLEQSAGHSSTSAGAPVDGASADMPAANRWSLQSEDWVHAKSLLNGHLDSARDNLQKGRNLLVEAIDLDDAHHRARIVLGHTFDLQGQAAHARAIYQQVLERSNDLVMRAYALEHLGCSFMSSGELQAAVDSFQQIIVSGAIEADRRFFTTYLNLAAAGARAGNSQRCLSALSTLYESFPEKRDWVKTQLDSHEHLRSDIASCPALLPSLTTAAPAWFRQ